MTWKLRSVVATILVQLVGRERGASEHLDRHEVVAVRAWRCRLARGAAADTRQTADIAVDVASVGFWTKFESGTFTP